MIKTLLEILNNAYCSNNAFLCLEERIKNQKITTQNTDEMIPKYIEQGDNVEVANEIKIYRETSKTMSLISLKYIYCYFGSSICHLFGNFKDMCQFYPDPTLAVIAYSPVKSNISLPYLWFNLNKNGTKIELVKQNNIHAKFVKVKTQQAKVYIDIDTKKSIKSSKGTFIEISVPDGSLISYYTKQDCIILITIDGLFINMYYQKSRCFVAFHPI